MVVADRVSLRTPPTRPQLRAPSAAPAERVELSPLSRHTSCPTGKGKAFRSLGEQSACAAGGGAALAPAARELEQFRAGLCPYLAQASQQGPQDMSALAVLSQALQDNKLDPVQFFDQAAEKFGPSFTVGEIRVEARPDFVQKILVDTLARPGEDRSFAKSSLQSGTLGALLGHESVFLADGQEWQTRRELMQPFFTGNTVLNDQTHGEIRAVVDKHLDSWGAEEDLGKRLKELTLDAVLHHMFGVELSPPELTSAARLFERVGAQGRDKLFGRKNDEQLKPELDALAERLLQGHGEMLEGLKATLADPARLREEVLSMTLLGHETTANLLSWALADATRSPERLAEVRAELDAELKPDSGYSATLDVETVRDLIRDTAANHPPNYLLLREARRDATILGETIKAGTQVLMPLAVTNREGAAESEEGRGRFYSFGGGRRVCLGQVFARLEAAVALSQILGRFDLEPVNPAVPGPATDFSQGPADNRYRLLPRSL